MSDLPATREEAQALGLPRYFTGQPCKSGHVAERWARNRYCVECVREGDRRWNAANPDKRRELNRNWRAANSDKRREYHRRYTKANGDKVRESARKWAEANREKVREKAREWKAANREKAREHSRKWKAENRDKRNADNAARRSKEINATPAWADMAAIKAIYTERARITAETGIEHHVDHIAPLRGRNVCGLHVEANLRVIPAAENIAKGNKDGPYKSKINGKTERRK